MTWRPGNDRRVVMISIGEIMRWEGNGFLDLRAPLSERNAMVILSTWGEYGARVQMSQKRD